MFFLLLTVISYFVTRALSDEAVYTLDAKNFDDFIKANPKVLVEFYAPWCGHCKKLAPEYERAAKRIHEDESLQTKIAKIDAADEKHKGLATKYGIRGFPTLKYFVNGDLNNPVAYNGGRTEDTIVQWIQARSLPAISKLKSKEEITNFTKKARLSLIAYSTNDDENSEEYKAIASIADNQRETISVGFVSDPSSFPDGVQNGDLFIYRKFDTPEVKYEGPRPITVQSIEQFLNEERFPLIDAISQENYKDYMDRGLPMAWIAIDGTNQEAVDTTIAQLQPIAKQLKGKLSFIWVDAVKYEKHIQSLGIKNSPGLVIVVGNNKKYLYEGSFDSKKDLENFFQQFSEGKLTAHLRSQPIPTENNESVYTLVGTTFNDIVGKDKDVFVEFYAPWCGHCKQLAPEYEKVGNAFANVDSMMIAKIDATENDTPEDIKGFPTLIFYPKNEKQGRKYSGERKAKNIIDWLKSQASGDVSAVKSEL